MPMHRKFTGLMLAILALALFVPSASAEDFRARKSHKIEITTEDDVKAELLFGREVAARILGRYTYHNDAKLARYVNLVGRSITQSVGRSEITFRFGVVKTDTINAYAAPGGYIFVTRGALMQMEDEAELAAVLAHEIAHVNGRHIVKELNIQASDDSPVSGFAHFVGGAGDPSKMAFLNLVDKALDILFLRGYKIEDEREADRTAVTYLMLSGYDPTALSRYFKRIKTIQGEPVKVLTSTHPSYDERIGLITKALETQGASATDSAGYHFAKERFHAIKKGL